MPPLRGSGIKNPGLFLQRPGAYHRRLAREVISAGHAADNAQAIADDEERHAIHRDNR